MTETESKNKQENEKEVDDLDTMTEASNLADPNRRIWVVTTAALPWMTGTAVNPLLRALYLTRGRPKDYVTLMIPWLEHAKERNKLYGKDKNFTTIADQEAWIRDFCKTRANCIEEEKNLRIQFYDSVYHQAFGSIFPLVDICGLVPDNEADIAILEEPEHLNWVRVPKEDEATVNQGQKKAKLTDQEKKQREKDQLGWAHKFRHVVGILHTNYGAYMKDYGVGTSIIAAPAIGMLSSTVVRAYCHKVIRLSAVLPSLAPNKEVTCNVHGVRSEFLDPAVHSTDVSSGGPYAPVYFIGKLIWAKGFDKVLKLQEMYKKETDTFFAMDIYGGGNDERGIKRGFYGRKGKAPNEETPKKEDAAVEEPTAEDIRALHVFSNDFSLRRAISERAAEAQSFEVTASPSGEQLQIAQVGPDVHQNAIGAQLKLDQVSPKAEPEGAAFSILGDLSTKTFFTGISASQAVYSLSDSIVKAGLTMSFTEFDDDDHDDESDDDDHDEEESATSDETDAVKAKATDVKGSKEKETVLDDDKEKELTKKEMKALRKKEMKEMREKRKKEKKEKKKPFFFDPPQSRFEFRRQPVPARFLGVKDHALMRDIPEHKIFLNMSVTEVLCTTTAEALAMGKFAIIPEHPSNTFFLQFPNCLAYKSIEECMQKLKWALENNPTPLTEDYSHRFTWEGANDRLFESAVITKREAKVREESGQDKADTEVARLHIDTTKTGRIVHNFFAQASGITSPK